MADLIKAKGIFTPAPLRTVVGNILSTLEQSAVRAQQVVVQEAQALVHVITGELRESIHGKPVVDTGQHLIANVVASAPHAAYEEFGTGIRGANSAGAGNVPYDLAWPGREAHPYLRPALDIGRAKVLEEFTR